MCFDELPTKTERITLLPVDTLWEYSQLYARLSSFDNDINQYDLHEITEHILINGIDPLELSIVDRKALVTDGNYRILAAQRLGYQEVPVRINVYVNRENVEAHQLERFHPIQEDLAIYLERLFD